MSGRRPRLLALLAVPAAAGAVAAVVVTDTGGGVSPRPPASTFASRPAPAAPRRIHPRVPMLSPAASRRAAVPILMYHVVNAAPPRARYPRLYVSRQRFAAEMRALRRAGYHATTLARVWAAWHAHGRLPRRPVVLSFDDGYASDVTHALPVLRRMRWPGVLNLELGKIGSRGAVTARMVRRLIAAGWEVDSHTITHPDLTTVDDARLRRELVRSRAEIRRRFGVPADFFCYPSGRYDARVEAAVRAAGYRAATTTQPGFARPAADRFALPRVRVDGGEPALGPVRAIAALRR